MSRGSGFRDILLLKVGGWFHLEGLSPVGWAWIAEHRLLINYGYGKNQAGEIAGWAASSGLSVEIR